MRTPKLFCKQYYFILALLGLVIYTSDTVFAQTEMDVSDSCWIEAVRFEESVIKDKDGKDSLYAYDFSIVNSCYLNSYPYLVIANKPLTKDEVSAKHQSNIIGYSQFYSYGERAWSMKDHIVFLKEKQDIRKLHVYLCTMRQFFEVKLPESPSKLTPMNIRKFDMENHNLEFSVDQKWVNASILLYDGVELIGEEYVRRKEAEVSGKFTFNFSTKDKERAQSKSLDPHVVLQVWDEEGNQFYYGDPVKFKR